MINKLETITTLAVEPNDILDKVFPVDQCDFEYADRHFPSIFPGAQIRAQRLRAEQRATSETSQATSSKVAKIIKHIADVAMTLNR